MFFGLSNTGERTTDWGERDRKKARGVGRRFVGGTEFFGKVGRDRDKADGKTTKTESMEKQRRKE